MHSLELIREYRTEDRDTLIILLQLNTPTAFAPEEEKDFVEYLDKRREEYFVFEVEGTIVACGGINFPGRSSAVISWDIVHPQHQGRGFGKRLLEFRIERIKTMAGIKTITVRTTQMAFGFYEKNGFVLNKVTENYWAPGFDLYLMEYDII